MAIWRSLFQAGTVASCNLVGRMARIVFSALGFPDSPSSQDVLTKRNTYGQADRRVRVASAKAVSGGRRSSSEEFPESLAPVSYLELKYMSNLSGCILK